MRYRSIVPVLVVVLLVVLTPAEAGAAARQPMWTRKVPALLSSVAATRLGGTVTAGTVTLDVAPPRAWSELYVARYSAGGRELWHRRWLPTRRNSAVARNPSVVLGPNGSVVTAGSVGARRASCPGWFVRVYGPRGDLRWFRRQRCDTPNVDVRSVAVTKHTIVVAANHVPYHQPGPHYIDAYLIEFSLHGRLIRTFDIEPTSRDWDDSVQDVTVGPAGTIFVTGSADLGPWTTDPDVGPVAPNSDPYVMAFSPTGSLLWEAMLNDHGTTHLRSGLSIDLGAGVLAVAADVQAQRRLGGFAYRLVRFSTTGRRVWSKTVPARIWPTWHPSWAEVAVAPTGAISLVASHADRPLLRTFRANGTVAWSARLGSGIRPHANTNSMTSTLPKPACSWPGGSTRPPRATATAGSSGTGHSRPGESSSPSPRARTRPGRDDRRSSERRRKPMPAVGGGICDKGDTPWESASTPLRPRGGVT